MSAQESDDEYDIHEAAWKNGKVKRQWAETCIQKVRQIDPNTFFGKGKVTELALYLAENPCSYVFINTTLTPNQTRNLETEARLKLLICFCVSARTEARDPATEC